MSLQDKIRQARGEVGIGKEKGFVPLSVLAKQKATEGQWALVEMAIRAFAEKYPSQWNAFVIDMKNRKDDFSIQGNKYGVSQEAALKKVDWRMTCSFPIVINSAGEVIDDLRPVIEKIIPALTHTRSKNFTQFLKRFPMFSPTYALSASDA